jgi:hypothetical protein
MDLIFNSLNLLRHYREQENFKGWDPYDGLNSQVFQSLPLLKQSVFARLCWIQLFKRSPVNFRRVMLVPKEYNAKGIALFLQGYCNLYKAHGDDKKEQETILGKIRYLADLLISLQVKGYSGACWGYNFDWQARRLFFFPKDTPTVVATSFCVSALLDAYQATKNDVYLKTAFTSAQFILKDLKRTDRANGFLLSYSPLPGNDVVINASLLGSRLLCLIYEYTKDDTLLTIARQIISTCCETQSADGSWPYGLLPVQNWIDSFHTGYNLDSLIVYQNISGDSCFSVNIQKGFEFYLNNFFMEGGAPKYYHDRLYPMDIHCPAQLIITLYRLNQLEAHKELAEKVMNWTIFNMQSPKGYFYYQLKKGMSSKIPYMRWSNAFVFNALSYYFLYQRKGGIL